MTHVGRREALPTAVTDPLTHPRGLDHRAWEHAVRWQVFGLVGATPDSTWRHLLAVASQGLIGSSA